MTKTLNLRKIRLRVGQASTKLNKAMLTLADVRDELNSVRSELVLSYSDLGPSGQESEFGIRLYEKINALDIVQDMLDMSAYDVSPYLAEVIQ